MPSLTSSQLAKQLGKSPGRISQMVAAGQLDGCYQGDGRARRFDPQKVAAALGQRLDPGQLMGNGAGTASALAQMKAASPEANIELPLAQAQSKPRGERLPDDDQDGYTLARTEKAIAEARKLKRQNAEAEGQYVLASEAQLEIKRLIGQEVAEFEQLLRVAARAVADELNVDFKATRKILLDKWRDHRDRRSRQLTEEATAPELSETEKAEDI